MDRAGNEGECNIPADSNPFRQASYEFDGTRDVTQNYLGEFKGDGTRQGFLLYEKIR